MRIYLTVDVETYTGDYGLDVYGRHEGLDWLLALLRRQGVPATFFVEAMGGERWGREGIQGLRGSIEDAGGSVQLHVHPEVLAADAPCGMFHYDQQQQRDMLARGIDVLKGCGVKELTAFRAGDLAADMNTLDAMRDVGLCVGSNRDLDAKSSIQSRVNGCFPIANDVSTRDGVTDYPVTACLSPFPWLDGTYRHMQITAMSCGEMCGALRAMARAGYRSAVVLTHPTEFFVRRGSACLPNAKNRRRIEQLIEFLGRREDMAWGVLDRMDAEEHHESPAQPLAIRLNRFHSLVRVVEQARARLVG